MQKKNYTFFTIDNLGDPAARALFRNNCRMRTYQSDALRKIFEGVQHHDGARFTVTFPRQSGKNETQAQLESAIMAANLYKGGSIIKLIPTEKNQGEISKRRLEAVLNVSRGHPLREFRSKSSEITYGRTRVRCLSANPRSAIVGATADLMLEVDESQMIPPDKFDREALPMAASTNAAVVCWGTAWDDQTLLARETRLVSGERNQEGSQAFRTTAAEVSREVPAYAEFVRRQIELLGREHPAIRTQFFCEEISDLTGMFTPARIHAMQGDHAPLDGPEPGRCYVFLIDIAGSDELTAASRRANGFSDRRDATVLTICEVSLPEGEPCDPKSYLWKTVARRYYRNVPAALLEEAMVREVERWDPCHIILDHSGLGCMLSDFLSRKYPWKCHAFDITPANKTKMAWEFISMIDGGRWKEYRFDELSAEQSGIRPQKDAWETVSDPAALGQMFIRELRACRMEPSDNGMNVRWGVKDGTKDPHTGRYLHDDLVMSAALAVFETMELPVRTLSSGEAEELQQMEAELERQRQRELWEQF